MKKPIDTKARLLQLAAEVKSLRATLIAKWYVEADGVTLTELGHAAVLAAEMEPMAAT
jgi:hypothetical protein